MNSKLQSGKPYSLETIFSGENNKVIIPDLQRDYCWGNPLSKDDSDTLVNSFLSTIFELEPHWDKDITMGLIYGYYDELTSYHLQLCDGQQRLTTLFLLLGVINRRLGDNPYRKILISDFELNRDDKEPHLLYSIRESSLYFLSDLTIHYFMELSFPVEDIEKQCWFLNSYNVDPTIQSILRAIKTIESQLDACDAERLKRLGDFLVKHIKFLFYDMMNRKNGEETFVVINTTGEPLSAAQNLKPKIIKADINKDYKHIAEDWEDMETWFWNNRRRNGIDTSTEGMLAFLHCVRVLECKTESEWHKNIDVNNEKFSINIPMQSIWEWFEAYKRIYESDFSRLETPKVEYSEKQSHDDKKYYHYTQKELYSLLPTMVYCKKFPHATENDLQRVYHLFYNMSRYRITTRSAQNDSINVPPYQLCRIVEKMESEDILSLLNVPEFKINEERSKLCFIQEIRENLESRQLLEKLFAKAETGKIFNGEIKTLVEWSNFDIGRFKQYAEIFNEVFVEPCNSNIDNVRRVLITYDLTNYPRCFTGYKNYSFGWEYDHWKKIITDNSEKIKHFFDDLLSLGDIDNNQKYETIIERKKNENGAWKENRYAPFVYNPKLLSACGEKNVQLPHKNITILLQGERANNSTVNYKILINGEVFRQESENWDAWKLYGDRIIYADHKRYDIAMDLIFEDNEQVRIRIFPRDNKYTINKYRFNYVGFADSEIGLSLSQEDGRWYTAIFAVKDIKTKCQDLQKSIESYLCN